MKKILQLTTTLLAGTSALHAGTVLDVDFEHLATDANGLTSDGQLMLDVSGNTYDGFYGGGSGAAVIAGPGGVGTAIDTVSNNVYMILRDARTYTGHDEDAHRSDPWTTPTPYFNFDSAKNYTFEAVLNWKNNTNVIDGIMGHIGANEWWIRENNGKLEYVFRDGTNSVTNTGAIDISSQIANSNWHHLAIVLNRDDDKIYVYLDHVLIHTDSNPTIALLGTIGSNTTDIKLGGYNGSSADRFDGQQDHYRISDTALTTAEFLPAPPVPPVRDITWTGTTDGTWDIATTQNWELDSDSSATSYTNTDNLTFDDNGANTAITIDAGGGTVEPGNMTFNHSSLAYSLAGDGIGGVNKLTKQGTGTLTLTNPNDYANGTDLQGGSIVAGDGATAGEIGAGAVSTVAGTTLTISRSDTLDYAGSNGTSGGSKLTELSGDGALVIDGGGTVVLNPGNGPDTDFDLANSWAGFSGSILVKGGSTLDTRRMGRSALGSGTVTLGDGGSSGSLAQHVGNWSFTNDIDLVGSANQIVNNNTSQTARYMKLQGVISGSGGLTFTDTNNTMQDTDAGFILTGANTLSGTVTIPVDVPVRVGGVPGDNFTSNPDAAGNLGTASVANEGVLTFSRTDAHQIDNAITGDGEVRFGLTGGGTETQVATIGTSQTYTGPTIVADGALVISNGVTLDSTIVDVQAAGTISGNGTMFGSIDVTGNIAPGTSVGTLTTTGVLGFLGDSTYTWEISTWGGSTPGTDHDVLLADTLDIVATNADPITIAVTPDSLSGFAETNQTYTIATATSSVLGFAADAFVVDATALPGALGTWAVQLSLDSLSLELVYTAGSASPYDIWAGDYGLENPWLGVDPTLNGEPTADPDGDSLTNEEEFAFGLDPTDASSVNPIVQDLDKTAGTFRYTRLAASGLTYTVETSTTLATWATDATASEAIISTVDGVETVEVTVTGAPLTDTAFFVRVDAQ